MNTSRFLVVIAVLVVATYSSLTAQKFLAPLRASDSGRGDFAGVERAFDEWSRGKDLSAIKGWKWYKRWEAFNAQRANPDGSLPDAALYWRGAMQAMSQKKANAGILSGSGWSPVGPVQLAEQVIPTWEPGMGRINCVAFHPSDPNTLWVGVAQGGVWKSVNGGETWMPLTDGLPILRISDIAVDPVNPDILYIAVGDIAYIGTDLAHENRKRNTHYGLGVFKTTDGGTTWNPTGLSFQQTDYDGSLICRVFVHPENTQYLLAAGTNGTWRSTDGGATWQHGRTDRFWELERDPSNPNVLYGSTGYDASFKVGSAAILKTEDFGESWTKLSVAIPPQGVQRIEIAVSPGDPNYVYAIACATDESFYAFYRSTNGGTTWTTRSSQANGAPNILAWLNGESWDAGGQGSYDLSILVDPKNRDRVYIGGVNIWGSEDGGMTWDGVSYWTGDFGTSLHGDHHFFAYNPLNSLYYVCNDGGIYTTEEPIIGSWNAALSGSGYQWPTVWRNISAGMSITSFYRLGLSKNHEGFVIAGAQDNSTFYTDGTDWWQLFGGDGMECMIHPDDPEIIYGSSQYGNIFASDHEGTRWLSNVILNGFGERGEWTTPFVMHPTKPGVLYAGFGNLYKSDGDDTLWSPISDFPVNGKLGRPVEISALSVSSANPQYIYIAKRIWHAYNLPSAVWMTPNEGGTWKNITAGLPDSIYFTYIATHGSDPKIAWITCSGFSEGLKVFKTTDAGSTWTNISRNLPNLPVNCVVNDPESKNNTVYIGTDIGVYYTNDKMDGWLPFNDNLPNVIVSELEIHQKTRKLYAATFGRGIWMSDLVNESSNSVDDAQILTGVRAAITPNPVHGAFTLNLDGCSALRSATVEIVDVTGRRVAHRDISISGSSHTERFDLDLPYGVYFLRLSHGVGSKVVRFVVN